MSGRMKGGRKKAAVLATVLLGLLIAVLLSAEESKQPEAPFTVTAFQVGKADALLITTQNSTVLIDTGEEDDGQDIVNYLEDAGRTRLDCLIVTHFDKDHVGGADRILEQLQVERMYQTNTDKKSDDYEEYLDAVAQRDIVPVTPGEIVTFTLDGAQYTIYPPGEHYEKKKSNNSSLIVGVEYGDTGFLFTGDAMDERLEEYLARYEPRTYDVVKMPYHGNYLDQLPAFLDKVSPDYAVITSSDEKTEDAQTLSELKKRNIETFLTRKGSVTVKSDGKKVQAYQ